MMVARVLEATCEKTLHNLRNLVKLDRCMSDKPNLDNISFTLVAVEYKARFPCYMVLSVGSPRK